MDKSTGGLCGRWVFIAITIILGGVAFAPYVDIPSVVIVFGGTIAVTAAQFVSSDLKRIMQVFKVALIVHKMLHR